MNPCIDCLPYIDAAYWTGIATGVLASAIAVMLTWAWRQGQL